MTTTFERHVARLTEMAYRDYRKTPLRLLFNGMLSSDEMRLLQQSACEGKFEPIYSSLHEDPAAPPECARPRLVKGKAWRD